MNIVRRKLLLGLKGITRFKTPTGGRLQQFALHKHGPGFELGKDREQLQQVQVTRAGIEPGTARL